LPAGAEPPFLLTMGIPPLPPLLTGMTPLALPVLPLSSPPQLDSNNTPTAILKTLGLRMFITP
jgi:hypothetical protein